MDVRLENTRPWETRFARFAPLTATGVCLLAYWTSLAHGVAKGDSPEVAQAVHLLGVMHPTGYPFFTLLTKLLTLPLAFIDEPATRVNAVVAIYGACAAGLIAANVRRLSGLTIERSTATPWAISAAGLLAGLTFGLSPLFYEQARLAEVYTLHVLLVQLALYFWLRYAEDENRRWALGAALAMGLGLAHHLTMAHLFPAALAFLLVADRRFFLDRRFPLALLIGAVTLLLYLYLPIADRTTQGFPWGGTSQWDFFWYHVTGRHYHHFLFESGQTALDHLVTLPLRAGGVITPLGALTMIYGVWRLAKTAWRALLLLLLYIVFAFTHAVGYNVGDWGVYLLAPSSALMLLAGAGLGAAAHDLLVHYARRPRVPAMVGAGLGILALTAIGFGFYHWTAFRAEPPTVPAMAEEITAALQPGSLLLMNAGNAAYATWYMQNVHGLGRDSAAVNVLRVRNPWYTDFLKSRWPWLSLTNSPHPRRVVKEALQKYLGLRKVYERDVYTRLAPLDAEHRLVNRGFINEIVLRGDAPAKRIYVRESYLLQESDERRAAASQRRFAPDSSIRLQVLWHDAVRRAGELRWIAPDGTTAESREFDIAAKISRSWFSLKAPRPLAEGAWRVEIRMDGVEVLGIPFTVGR
ncbi:MAG: DUF2723 domain-containing protein [Myxococcales bacterium]|nr:MAG: DUF2723 domain-containing protein [Myxococcales bacterium]